MTNLDIKTEQQLKLSEGIHFVHVYISAPIVMLFWLADFVYIQHSIWLCLAIRSVIIPLCLAVVVLNRSLKSMRSLEFLAIFSAFVHGVVITTLIALNGGFSSPYYAGLNLVIIAAIAVVNIANSARLLVAAAVIVPYYVVGIIHAESDMKQYAAMIFNSIFIIATTAVSILIASFHDQLQRAEFAARQILQQEIASRDRVIQAQTEVNVHMRLLSRQFSPQVVKSILDGEIGDIRPIQRRKICVVFIDIENSTSRIVRLDKDDVTAVISLFMHDVMSILLKYDITIDKFLGDGVLAFSNHPVANDDFVQRVVNAALEIKARIKDHRDKYLEHWKNELGVTIGIDVGYADVGFYGGGAVPQTYTAIGEAVNFAKRLSDSAEANQILISHGAVKLLKRHDYAVNDLGERTFKGFEDDLIPVYEITASHRPAITSGIDLCPIDQSVLHLAKSEEGIYVLKCRECGHVLTDERLAAPISELQTKIAA